MSKSLINVVEDVSIVDKVSKAGHNYQQLVVTFEGGFQVNTLLDRNVKFILENIVSAPSK